MTIHGILPAAGHAVRLRRLPKFLLPCDENATTLIEKHIEELENLCEIIWLPVRPDLVSLVHDLNLGDHVIPVAMSTKTMSETVLRIGNISGADSFLLGMPDTAFVGEQPYSHIVEKLKGGSLSLALWETSDSQRGKVGAVEIIENNVVSAVDKDADFNHKYHWGAMAFKKDFLSLLTPEMPHTGYVINEYLRRKLKLDFYLVDGQYFDCGTFTEYKKFIGQLNK